MHVIPSQVTVPIARVGKLQTKLSVMLVGSGLCWMTGPEVGGALVRQHVSVLVIRPAGHGTNQKSLVIPHAPAVDDRSLDPRGAPGEHGRSGDASTPMAAAELVDRVARFFAKKRS